MSPSAREAALSWGLQLPLGGNEIGARERGFSGYESVFKNSGSSARSQLAELHPSRCKPGLWAVTLGLPTCRRAAAPNRVIQARQAPGKS